MRAEEPFDLALDGFVAQARAAWPEVRVETSRFVAYVLERLPATTPRAEALAALDPAGLYLACACADGDERAIVALEAAYFADATPTLRRMAATAGFVDEVKQSAREKLFVGKAGAAPKIAEFAGRGDLRTFVRVLMTREGLNLRRKGQREVLVDEGVPRADGAFTRLDPELAHLRTAYGAEFERAFHDAVCELSSQERNLLRYHYLDRLNIDQIGVVCGIHRASAARRLTKVRQALIEGTRHLLAQRLRLGTGELESVLRLLESEIDISLRRALGDASARA
jgi:RNA polymerase sigma-70 factor (ECF subfamily)